MTRNKVKLTRTQEFSIQPTAPFNFDATLHKPSHFPSSDNFFEPGVYWQSMRFEGKVLGLKFINTGSVKAPSFSVITFSLSGLTNEEIGRLSSEIRYRFDTDSNLASFYKLCRKDELLKPVFKRWPGMRVSTGYSLYEFLVIATVLQNATIRRSVQMTENLFARFGRQIIFDEKTLSVFWEPKDIHLADEEVLRRIKLGYRARTLKRQAEQFISWKLNEAALREAKVDELRSTLLNFYGIGPASVWYLLFEVFKKYDAIDYISPWEQKIYSKILFNKKNANVPKILVEIDKRWGQWKMLAVHHLFEDLFWRRRNESIPWLEELIRL